MSQVIHKLWQMAGLLAGMALLTGGCGGGGDGDETNATAEPSIFASYQGMAIFNDTSGFAYVNALGLADLTLRTDGTYSAWVCTRSILPMFNQFPYTEFRETVRYDGTYEFDGQVIRGDGARHDGWGTRLAFSLSVTPSLDITGGRLSNEETYDSSSCRVFEFIKKASTESAPLAVIAVVEKGTGAAVTGARVEVLIENHCADSSGVSRTTIFSGSGYTDGNGIARIGTAGEITPYTVNGHTFYEFTDSTWISRLWAEGYHLYVSVGASGFQNVSKRFLTRLDGALTTYAVTRMTRSTAR